jgi:hypothetical protein
MVIIQNSHRPLFSHLTITKTVRYVLPLNTVLGFSLGSSLFRLLQSKFLNF